MEIMPDKWIYAPSNILVPHSENLELKPCPFCGNKEIVYEKYQHEVGARYRVFCTQCMAGIDPGFAQTIYIVRDMWNNRV